MNNLFYLILKVFFVLKILDFCLDFLVMMKKCRDWKEKVNFKLYDVTALLTNNYYIHIA